jgi:Tfp pilus assembly protein PilO
MRLIATPRATLAVGVVVLVVVAAASWLLLLSPVTSTLSETRTQHAETVEANLLLAVRLHAVEKQEEELPTTVAAAEDLATMFPATADQPGFFDMLGKAAAAAGIGPDQVTTLSPTVPVRIADLEAAAEPATPTVPAATDLAYQSVTVSVEAPYEQIEELLRRIERMDRAFLVQDVSITTENDVTTGEVVGSIFLAPPLTPPGGSR